MHYTSRIHNKNNNYYNPGFIIVNTHNCVILLYFIFLFDNLFLFIVSELWFILHFFHFFDVLSQFPSLTTKNFVQVTIASLQREVKKKLSPCIGLRWLQLVKKVLFFKNKQMVSCNPSKLPENIILNENAISDIESWVAKNGLKYFSILYCTILKVFSD